MKTKCLKAFFPDIASWEHGPRRHVEQKIPSGRMSFFVCLVLQCKTYKQTLGELFILLVVKVSGCKIAHFPLLFFSSFFPFEIILIMYEKGVCSVQGYKSTV